MENLTNKLSRVCGHCGLEKPLSAFLQLSHEEGASYGKICAQCRGTYKNEKSVASSVDESQTTDPSGAGIRGKEKVYREIQEQKIHDLKDLYRKREETKKETLEEQKKNRINLREESEKKHRQIYIQPQKLPDHLSHKNIPDTSRQILARTTAERQKAILETKKRENSELIKEEARLQEKKKYTDLNILRDVLDAKIDWQQGQGIKNWMNILGESAPIQQLFKNSPWASSAKLGKKEAPIENKSILTSPTRKK
jgi:hypothetical protein